MTTTILLGAAMLGASGAAYAGSRVAALVLMALSCAWLVLSVRPEGPVLWEVAPEHGLVVADLWGLLGIASGALLLVRSQRRRRGDRRTR